MPIDFDGTLSNLPDSSPFASYLPAAVIRINEPGAALAEGPSEEAVASIRKTFTIVRQDKKRMRVFAAVAFTFGIVVMGAAWLAYERVQADNNTLIAQSRVLAGKAEDRAEAGDGTGAALVALEGLIDGRTGEARPSSTEALKALYSEFHTRREIAIPVSHAQPLNVIAVSPKGETFAVGSVNGDVRVLTFAGVLIYGFHLDSEITEPDFQSRGHTRPRGFRRSRGPTMGCGEPQAGRSADGERSPQVTCRI